MLFTFAAPAPTVYDHSIRFYLNVIFKILIFNFLNTVYARYINPAPSYQAILFFISTIYSNEI